MLLYGGTTMIKFFDYFPDMYEGSSLTGFEYYGPLLLGVLTIVLFYFIKDKITKTSKRNIIFALGGILAFSEIADKIYVYYHLGWSYDLLSLHLCSISAIVGVYLIFFNQNRTLFGIWFFWSLQGALQALLSPTVTVGFEFFKYYQFFLHHVLLIILPLTILYFNNWIPTFKDVKNSYIWLIVVSIPVIIFNSFTGMGYMFVSLTHDARPTTGSPLDYLGPYPFYIISLFAFVFALLLITYLPFKFIYHRKPKQA